MRPCNGCTACCDGLLIGEVRGRPHGNGDPCYFVGEGCCNIHDDRPPVCQNYYCAWAQGVIDEWAKPSDVKFLVSIEVDANGKQFFKLISQRPVDHVLFEAIEARASELGTYVEVARVIPLVRR